MCIIFQEKTDYVSYIYTASTEHAGTKIMYEPPMYSSQYISPFIEIGFIMPILGYIGVLIMLI